MYGAARFRALMLEDDRIRTRDGGTIAPQVRGSRFKQFIAEMLGLWGIEALTRRVEPSRRPRLASCDGRTIYVATGIETPAKRHRCQSHGPGSAA